MSKKSANVTVRVQPEIKEKAEAVLEQIGMPVSVLINTLYRQIIMTGGIPFSLSVHNPQTLDTMTSEQFDAMMEKGYNEAISGNGKSINEAFKQINEDI
ncbi:RelB/DinJ family addiction module antitoxin [Anaeromassilibacillus sp. An172]|uniref:type II toxin-antitoxin system RelB/DinJ family antitoxin n=1 Tax=Anaeromassilibacillus sp. An172 TaxID=1965570 RepID=UPI000B36CC4A|nr:type II toxin-antitoxin system RelB/DinJ family antitoxin [Anaeromassilibacillus sp. An172]OUP77705.1 RelB/DinJ family addiction module antitoxin [Anaeromassilibacillus sp. An172]